MKFIQFLKQGNTSSAVSALGNVLIAIVKGIAAFITGSGAMFATMVHSIADAINQGMVFFGSALAEKEPTKRFPSGFGRVVNLFVLLAVIVISIMAYETILKGWEIIQDPEESSRFWLNVIVLIVSIGIDGSVLVKVMLEIVKESHTKVRGLNFIPESFKNISYASPPTRLVFYEDIVATFGGFLALVTVIVSQVTGNYIFDGIGTILIGVLLVGIAIKIGYENTIGLIGVAAPKRVEDKVVNMILDDHDVVDIRRMRILQEGKNYHVESYIELRKGLSLEEADDIKFRVIEALMEDPDVDDVTLGIIETDEIQHWKRTEK
ncbi:cation transporter [Halalkalibacillus sediminis]|uniref:Cation transporter n=1 Tax=Halalkalibacillus sediminis TaxID=2018042 RepID=A0A2I0QUN1_9BACI|nr:cation diffusion facilitator family transporter [Halalkalibacillus sediminis]PKR78053.1 cation transporter [Halalkalibacillus sediminis]